MNRIVYLEYLLSALVG